MLRDRRDAPHRSRLGITLVLPALLAAVTLSACGIKGPLKPAATPTPQQPAPALPGAVPAPNAPAPGQAPPPPVSPTVPSRP